MKKKALICLLGSAIVGAIAYYCYTMNKVSDIDDDTLEPDDEDLEDEDIFDDDIDIEFDEPIEPESKKVVQFNDVEQDDIFRQNNPIAVDEDEGDELEDPTESIIGDTPINVLDYDTSYFELVCNISREEAIRLILKENDIYTEEQLKVMTNSELADIYSKIVDN